MALTQFLIRAFVYLICFVLAWHAMSAVQFERILKKNHVWQAQVLYVLIVMALGYLSGSFILAIAYFR